MKKQVKLIGLSVNNQFGGLNATELQFDPNNRLIVVKGEVGAGKTTLNKALGITTKGNNTLQDKSLYGDNVDLTSQLLDGDVNIYVNTKSDKNGGLTTKMYTLDNDGKKVNSVVVDGQKLTPSKYLDSLQTKLTWRLDELTSENPTVQRNLLLELYASELEKRGVVFDKKHPKYVGGIIDQIEKAKNDRNYADMKRKEVGGIAEDLKLKGISYEERRQEMPTHILEAEINDLKGQISFAKTNVQQARTTELQSIELEIGKVKDVIRLENDKVVSSNNEIDKALSDYTEEQNTIDELFSEIKLCLSQLNLSHDETEQIVHTIDCKVTRSTKPTTEKQPEVHYKDGKIQSTPESFTGVLKDELQKYYVLAHKYVNLRDKPLNEADTTSLDNQLQSAAKKLETAKIFNQEAKSINALHDWKEANERVKELQTDYFMKLTDIETGVDGLKICPEYSIDEKGNKVAKGNDIYLMYDGSYDVEYFHNPNKELRKLSAYSDTQKPMICLLIQNYLLSKKGKCLPYLWIDKVPIDNKTRALIEKMSEELDLYLFVSWTGDFEQETLKDGEILINNGEIFFKN